MYDALDFKLQDDKAARVRLTSVADAEALLALELALAADGRGMVTSADDVRSVDAERRRIDDIYRGISAGDATLSVVAELTQRDDSLGADGGVPGRPRILGLAELKQLRPARCRHVGTLSVGVHPSAQHLGVGRALLNALIDHAESADLLRLDLFVRADNERAIALYRSLGFVHEGTRRRFVKLEDGSAVDDHTYVRFLD
jgi:putative acetyltransferase